MGIKRVALVGLGAIGSYLAPRLERALGHENFLVVASGERRARLEREGTVINGETYHFTVADPAEGSVPPADLVIFAVKWPQLAQAVEEVRPLVGEDTALLSLLNGVESEEVLARAYGWDRVLYGLIRVSSKREGHAVAFDPGAGCIFFGEKRNAPPYTPRVAAIAALFDRAGIRCQISEDMVKEVWLKFCTNIGENMTSAVIGNWYGTWRRSEHAVYTRRAAYLEVLALAEKLGVSITEEEVLGKLSTTTPFYNKPSTRQDIEARRPTEVDMFSGAVVRMGRELGVPTPVNEWLYHAIRLIEEMNAGKLELPGGGEGA